MATRRATSNPPTAPDGDESGDSSQWRIPAGSTPGLPALPEDDDDESDNPLSRVTILLRSLSGMDNARVSVYRQVPNSANLAFCRDYSVGDYEAGGLQMIRDDWGPGAYQLRVYGVKPETGRFGVMARALVHVAPMATTREAVAPSSALETALAKIVEQNAAIVSKLSEPPKSGIEEALTLLARFKEAGLIGGAASQKSPAEAMSEFLVMFKGMQEFTKQLAPERDEPSSDMGKMLELGMSIVSIVRDQVAPRPAGHINPVALPGSMVPMQTPAIAGAAPAPEPPSSAEILASAKIPPRPSIRVPDEHGAEFMSWFQTLSPEQQASVMQELTTALSQLLQMARAGKSAEEGSDFIADRLPDELLDFLDVPGWFDILASMQPQVREHEAWIREAVRLLDVDPGDSGDASSPPPPPSV